MFLLEIHHQQFHQILVRQTWFAPWMMFEEVLFKSLRLQTQERALQHNSIMSTA
jgi:hypothetical protein